MRWGGNIIKGLIEVSIVRLVPEAKRLDMMGEFFEVLINFFFFFFFFFSTRESFSFLHVVLIPYQGSLALTGLCCGFVNALTKNIKPNMISRIQIAHSAFLFGYTINPRHMFFAESKQLSILHHPVLPHCFWNHGCAPVNCPGQEYLGLWLAIYRRNFCNLCTFYESANVITFDYGSVSWKEPTSGSERGPGRSAFGLTTATGLPPRGWWAAICMPCCAEKCRRSN
jgi:hypothetical protein